MNSQPLVLASSSIYRSELLKRLNLPFTTDTPDVDETPFPDESAIDTSLRLCLAKARAVAARHPDALIIGSDQVALLDGAQLGKPRTHENAVRQLRDMSGRSVLFHTALCLLNARTGHTQRKVVTTDVAFRPLSDEQIERYLRAEQPYDCAGSAKSEGLGISLIRHIRGDDPNALIGLPLIELVSMLNAEGVQIP